MDRATLYFFREELERQAELEKEALWEGATAWHRSPVLKAVKAAVGKKKPRTKIKRYDPYRVPTYRLA
tara:strand:+ start:187 stop:390 length:204 start_codon:yes stop_codon:yes gene_type:complete